MPSRLGIFTEANARKLLNAVNVFESSGLLQPGILEQLVQSIGNINKGYAEVYFKNDTGETIPPYACLQATDTDDLFSVGGTNYLLVDKPADTDASAGPYLFNGHTSIEPDGRGVAQRGRINLRASYVSGTPTAGEKWAPIVDSFDIEQSDSGPFIAIGTDDIGENHGIDVVKIALDAGSPGSIIGFTIDSVATESDTSSPYYGLKVASVTVETPGCGLSNKGDSVDVVDHSLCIFDDTSENLADVYGWAYWGYDDDLSSGASAGDLSPCHWCALNRCCI